jgi:glycine/D-amino acid oxidase-like deaminating enzyme/nitrite reductase/ring-hydroxylating ferredoxin subunit
VILALEHLMQTETQQHPSYWTATAPHLRQAPLTHDTRADVCVVGAGIAGLSTAYLLVSAGQSVIVLDDGPIADGQTRQTTAHLSNALDDRYIEIEKWHGPDGARLAAESHTAAIEKIGAIVRDEQIDCDYERLDGYLFVPPGQSADILEQEFMAAHRAGLKDVEMLKQLPSPWPARPCLRFPGQGQFHPLRYIAGLALALTRKGGRIFTGTQARQMVGGSSAHVVTAKGPQVACSAIVVATNTPVNDLFAIHTKQAPYLTYALAAPVPRGWVTKGLYWDTLDPYHYVRLQKIDTPTNGNEALAGLDPAKEELLIVGGEDHKTGQASDQEERYGRLEEWARQHLPRLGRVTFRWSGQVMEPIDGVAFIGRNPSDADNVYIATGDSGMGITHGTIAGILLTDLILGRENPWAKLYDPSRKTLRAADEFLSENLNVAKQYAEWLTGGESRSLEDIPAGTGAVIRQGLSKLAIYRDGSGAAHVFSAVCPHLGCLVTWNGAEKTWDCPCHGSRFACTGAVVNGPANKGLEPLKIQKF